MVLYNINKKCDINSRQFFYLGDISPITSIEKVYGIIMTLISCGIFAYAVNIIGEIFSSI